jgi:hypothetical protein
MMDATCANCDEVKVLSNVSFLNDDVVRISHLRDQIANHFCYLDRVAP